MCDYSLEHLHQTKAKEGEKYLLDGRLTHGFVTLDSSLTSGVTAACVIDGQRLKLTNVRVHPHWERTLGLSIAKTVEVLVVQRKKHPDRFNRQIHGPYNDLIELADGTIIPIAMLIYADMVVMPAKQPKPKKRNLATLLGLDKKDEKPLREVERMTRSRDRVDAD